MRSYIKNKKWIITAIALSFLIIFTVSFIWYGILKPHRQEELKKIFETANQYYLAKDFEKAVPLIKNNVDDLISLDSGCDLVLSIFAESASFKDLETSSLKCLKKESSKDIAYEGVAYSLSSQGRFAEAIEILNKEETNIKAVSDRLEISLARLHLMISHDNEPKEHFLKAIKHSTTWGVWLAYILKLKVLRDDVNFLEKLADLVLVKKKLVSSPVETLIMLLKKYEKHQLANDLLKKIAN